jgi:hypothetical protein
LTHRGQMRSTEWRFAFHRIAKFRPIRQYAMFSAAWSNLED